MADMAQSSQNTEHGTDPLRAPRRSQADPLRQATASLVRWHAGVTSAAEDELAVEEPLEIRLRSGDDPATPAATEPIAVIMRTPGADDELAVGFLYSEGLLASADELRGVIPGEDADGLPSPNLLDIIPAAGAAIAERLRAGGVSRAFAVSASCGVCGRNSIAAVCAAFPPHAAQTPLTSASALYTMPDQLRAGQRVFSSTGGLHAAGLFTPDGTLIALREDVGRHNAVDKLVGRALLDQALPLEQTLLLVSGRLSFEIVQKVVAAGIPLVAAVSAPSSLAVDLARESGVTLVAFLRGASMNIYTHPARVLSDGRE